MKNYLFILLSIVTLTSYSMGENILDKKIDTSSKKAFEKSMIEIKNDLSKEDMAAFQKGLMPIVFTSSISANFAIKKGLNKNEAVQKALRIALEGKTARDIIGNVPSEKNTNEKKEDIKILKIGEPVVFSDIEITITGVSIGKLKAKYKNSYSRAPKKNFLLVKVQLKNLSEGKIRTIQNPWKNNTTLQDNFDNYYRVRDQRMSSSLVNVISSERIRPGVTLTDTIIFEVPIENAKEFTLMSTPAIYKAKGDDRLEKLPTGEFNFKFNRSDIK